MAETDNTLHLAVTMAGAVSAGSYTGGVMDYLLEALEAWEKAKKAGDVTVPTHQVCIDLLNGTSAGGMTAIIAGVALQSTIEPVSPGNEAAKATNKLYRSWVELTGDDNILPMLLKNDDIKDDLVPSLLNSTFIETIADRVVTKTTDPPPARPYIAPELEVMVTLSNLLGIQYKVFFGPDEQDAYVACNHLDFGHFVFSNRPYSGDGRIPVSLSRAEDCALLRACAMATGAFPVGLAARTVERKLKFIQDDPSINLNSRNSKTIPGDLSDPYTTVNVDGGLLNNEPFDRAEELFFERFGKGVLLEKLRAALDDTTPSPHNPLDRTVGLFAQGYGKDNLRLELNSATDTEKIMNSFFEQYGKDALRNELKKPEALRYTILMIDPFPSVDFNENALSVADAKDLTKEIETFVKDEDAQQRAYARLRTFLVTNRQLSPEQAEDVVKLVEPNMADTGKKAELTQRLQRSLAKRENPPKTYLKALIGPIFNTMRQQLMFKQEDIQASFDANDYSRFLVGPKRTRIIRDKSNNEINQKLSGSKAIACGSFGGFGGFVSKDFRDHDFYLGRLNCKRFLKRHFGVPVDSLASNPLFRDAYSAEALKFSYPDDYRKDAAGNALCMVPIIPIIDDVPENPIRWPSTTPETLSNDDLREKFKSRARGVLGSLLRPNNSFWLKKWLWRGGVWVALHIFDGKVADTVLELIEKDFTDHNLLAPTGDVSRDTPSQANLPA